jgi:hypothetical protein
MIRPPKIEPKLDLEAGKPRVMPMGLNCHVPMWWVDEYNDRARLVCTSAYDKLQSARDAETGTKQANYIIDKAMGRLR